MTTVLLPFREAAAAPGPLNHTGYFCFVLSIPLPVYKHPLTLADTCSSPDNPVCSFLLTRMSEMTSLAPLMSFSNLMTLNTGQSLTPITTLVDTLLFCFQSAT